MGEESIESKVLLAEWSDDDSLVTVSAEEIAFYVADGWTLEAIQWSAEPGEALCAIVRRAR